MPKKIALAIVLLAAQLIFLSCENSPDTFSTRSPIDGPPPKNEGVWNIPANQIISGGVPKDGIPSLFDPSVITGEEANYLGDEELVVGIVVNGQPRAYPHSILDWHEIINENLGSGLFTISYCPLTGSAIVFDGQHSGVQLIFGVSGLLYNNNLIMFDRETDSHWPQMRLQCDEGTLRNTKQQLFPSIETSWGTWKKLYPKTVVLSTNTGFSRPYQQAGSAYPNYNRINAPPLFQMESIDERLPIKQRVHGILFGSGPDFITKVYLIDASHERRLIHDFVANEDILVIDAGKDNFVVSYLRTVEGTLLTFEIENAETFPFTFKDKETNSTWNVLGEATDGPLAGKKLESPPSFNSYWFAWGAFFEGADIYDN